jgi:hypothetical protein
VQGRQVLVRGVNLYPLIPSPVCLISSSDWGELWEDSP